MSDEQVADARKPKVSADTVTAVAAVFVAALALFVSIWQGCETRRHNRLSVTPHIDVFWTSEFDDQFGVVFDNAGIGPARILEFTIFVDEESYNEEDLVSGRWRSVGLVALGLSDVPVSSFWLSSEDAIIEGRRRFILSIPNDSSKEVRDQFWKALKQVKIVIKYESFYGDTFATEWTRDTVEGIQKSG